METWTTSAADAKNWMAAGKAEMDEDRTRTAPKSDQQEQATGHNNLRPKHTAGAARVAAPAAGGPTRSVQETNLPKKTPHGIIHPMNTN